MVEESSYIILVRVLYSFPAVLVAEQGFIYKEEGEALGYSPPPKGSFPNQKILATTWIIYIYIILDIFRFSYNTLSP